MEDLLAPKPAKGWWPGVRRNLLASSGLDGLGVFRKGLRRNSKAIGGGVDKTEASPS